MRYVAFLRAINVGGQTATKGELISVFESLGFEEIETFLASGNVIFTTGRTAPATLEKRIAAALEQSLGFAVATFLRTGDEVLSVVKYRPFPEKMLAEAPTLNIGFTAQPFSQKDAEAVDRFRSEIDQFHLHGREVYWLCDKRQSESKFNGGKLERALGRAVTFRSISSLTKLAEKHF
ncbi:MAG: DUF1697 domain-containing protein [bacterium]|nr:DUF1697 domain-containing protein [bacterium]